jgi:hypothetical protein
MTYFAAILRPPGAPASPGLMACILIGRYAAL